MTTVKTAAKAAKQHTVYKAADGKRVPGVTTITGVLDKPALVRWANRIGLEGIEVGKYVDDLANVGTCGHLLIQDHIRSQIDGVAHKSDYGMFSQDQINLAENVFLKFLTWEKEYAPDYILSEAALVHEGLRYGGTVDCYCQVGGKLTLVDFKTCKAIYKDHWHQVAGGYAPLLEVNGHKVEDVRILRIGREESEGDTEYVQVDNRKGYEKMFLLCREVYEIKKSLKMY